MRRWLPQCDCCSRSPQYRNGLVRWRRGGRPWLPITSGGCAGRGPGGHDRPDGSGTVSDIGDCTLTRACTHMAAARTKLLRLSLRRLAIPPGRSVPPRVISTRADALLSQSCLPSACRWAVSPSFGVFLPCVVTTSNHLHIRRGVHRPQLGSLHVEAQERLGGRCLLQPPDEDHVTSETPSPPPLSRPRGRTWRCCRSP